MRIPPPAELNFQSIIAFEKRHYNKKPLLSLQAKDVQIIWNMTGNRSGGFFSYMNDVQRAQLRKKYLKDRQPGTFALMLMENALTQHLINICRHANEQIDLITSRLAQA